MIKSWLASRSLPRQVRKALSRSIRIWVNSAKINKLISNLVEKIDEEEQRAQHASSAAEAQLKEILQEYDTIESTQPAQQTLTESGKCYVLNFNARRFRHQRLSNNRSTNQR
jgi:DNA-binding protein H-NS